MKKTVLIFAVTFLSLGTTILTSSVSRVYATEDNSGLTMTFEDAVSLIEQNGLDIAPEEAYEAWMKWRGERQSNNVIDLRGVPSFAHTFFKLAWEAGYRW